MTVAALRQRPIFGGVFGRGRYALASVPCVAHGLHSVRFMVIEPRDGAVLSVAEEKAAALGMARTLLKRMLAAEAEPDSEPQPEQARLWPDEPALAAESVPLQLQVSRRRREIFDRSNGACHYCGVVLELAGPWHAEHMKPKALGGTDDAWNLVAACVPCNLSKRDRTALEFLVEEAPDRSRSQEPVA